MAIKYYKPTTAGLRKSSIVKLDITKKEPEKNLIKIKKSMAGRSGGKITVRHQGGGAKQFYRIIDFKRDRFEMPAKVVALEYDPNRTALIALVSYSDNEKRYIIAPSDLKVGDEIISSKNQVDLKAGNAMPLKHIPSGTMVHNIELVPGQGAQMARSAGSQAIMMGVEGGYAQLKLPSKEIRLVSSECLATIGQVSKAEHSAIRYGKAGRMRNRGIRPSVRGKAMSPRDHPHGGGEGVNPIGLRYPKTKWGKHALGVKTRNKKKWSSKFIIKRRR